LLPPDRLIISVFQFIVAPLRPFGLAVLAGFSGLAAAVGCPPIDASLPRSSEEIDFVLRQTDVYVGLCANDTSWFAERGALLLSAGRYAEAAESLERAILLTPSHAGARIDYADALAALGDSVGALALADSLLALPELPLKARAHLQARIEVWREASGPVAPAGQYQADLGLQLGWESNLNGGPAADSVVLTPPEGAVRLPLDGSLLPRSGLASILDLDVRGLHSLSAEWSVLAHGQLRLRDAPNLASDYLLSQADVSLIRRRRDGDLAFQASLLNQNLGSLHLLEESRLIAQYTWGGEFCRPSLGADIAARSYPAAPLLDGTQYGLRLGLQCADGVWRVSSDLRIAEDYAHSPDRPGGRQQWAELHLGGAWQGAQGRAKVGLNLGAVHDADGYSSLLASNARRHVWRSAVRIELAHPLTRHWELGASLEYFRQQSNIGLFGLDNTGLYFGARYRY